MQQEKLLITPKDPAESNRVHSLLFIMILWKINHESLFD